MDLINQALNEEERSIQKRRNQMNRYQKGGVPPASIQEYERVYTREQIDQFQRQRGEYRDLLEPEDPDGGLPIVTTFEVISGWSKGDFDWNAGLILNHIIAPVISSGLLKSPVFPAI